ncbi:MAG: 30S ribosomal protein S20 [Patescibacteria group bacterium]
MPLIKSAIKRMRQSRKRHERLLPVKSHMKTMVKNVLQFAKQGKKEEAAKLLPQAFKAVDMAAKKYIIHWKNGARKKSLMSRAVAGIKK